MKVSSSKSFVFFLKICYIFSMKAKENVDEQFKKAIEKRNYYTTNDAGKVFFYCFLLPIMLGFVFSYLGLWIASLANISLPETSAITELYQNYIWFSIPYALLTQVCFIAIFFVYNKLNRIKFSAIRLEVKKVQLVPFLLCALLGIIFVFGLFGLIEGCFGKLFELLGVEISSNPIPLNNFGWYVFYVIFFAIVPAFCEELIFRGVIFRGLNKGLGVVGAVLLSALLFALVHLSLNQLIYPFIMGCLFALIVYKTGNLVYSMIFHLFNNITTITITYLKNINVINLNFEVNYIYIVVSLALAIVAGVIFFLVYKFYFSKLATESFTEEGENYSVRQPVMLGKLPLVLYLGIILSIIVIVINAVA